MGLYGKTIAIDSKLFRELENDQEILIQSILMRLNTRRGKLPLDPEYGLVVTDYLQRGMTPEVLARIPFEIQEEVEKDTDRIDSVRVEAKVSGAGAGAGLLLRFEVTPKTVGPFAFTLTVPELTVEILKTGKV